MKCFMRGEVPDILKDCSDTFMRCEVPYVLQDCSDTVLLGMKFLIF